MTRMRHEDGNLTTTAPVGGQSAMAHAASMKPFTAYTYRGGEVEPPAVAAARERYRAHTAELEAERSGAGPVHPLPARRRPAGPSRPAPAPAPAPAPVPVPVPAARAKRRDLIPVSAELAADLFPGTDFTGVFAAAQIPESPAERCRSCGYLTTAPSHAAMCGGAS